jgi:hypothetical protein
LVELRKIHILAAIFRSSPRLPGKADQKGLLLALSASRITAGGTAKTAKTLAGERDSNFDLQQLAF